MSENRENWNQAIQERTVKNKAALLEQFREMPVLQVALARSSLSRSTYYHWRDTDPEFKKNADQAIAEGEAFITDMSESQLISLIKDKHFPSVQLWLRQHHPKYANKVELSGSLSIEDDELSEEEAQFVAHVLGLADTAIKPESQQSHEPRQSSE